MFPLLTLAALTVSAPAIPPFLGSSEDQLAGSLRGLLLQHVPDPLYDASPGWGRTKDVKVLRMHDGRLVHETHAKNDGLWKKIRVTAVNPRDNLVLDLRDVSTPAPNAMAFTLFVAADIHFDASQEQWESGVKLYGA